MKKIMMMLFMATVALTASAQNTLRDNGTFTLQPKVGLGFGTISGEWRKPAGVSEKARVGLVVGLEGEYYVNSWLGIAAGFNYAQQGWKFDGNGTDATLKLDYLNIPLTADFYVAKGLALKTGVQFGFLTNAKADSNKPDESGDIKDSCKKLNVSIPLGISYEISNFILDLRYNFGITKTNNTDVGKARSNLLQITLGYKIPL